MGAKLAEGSIVAGRFRLNRLLGEGGMGTVWAATHTITRQRRALKFLKAPEQAGTDTRQRFLREARAACAVEHPNIVAVHDVFELDDGAPVMVMDLLDGETLRDKLDREGSLAIEPLVAILLPVVSAVGAAHERGIVHRDLKPENVFLVERKDEGADVMVLDFGIAKLVAPEGTREAEADTLDAGVETGTGTVLGSPQYMAPEQGSGEPDIDHRVDIWALGIMLYEALSGVRPIDGANFGQVLKRLLTGKIPPIENLEPNLPAELADLVGRMLSRERDERPDDLREVADVLGRYGEVSPPSFGPAQARVRPAAAESAQDQTATSNPPPSSPRAALDSSDQASTKREIPLDPPHDAGRAADSRPDGEEDATAEDGPSRRKRVQDTADGTVVPVASRGSRRLALVAALAAIATVATGIWMVGSRADDPGISADDAGSSAESRPTDSPADTDVEGPAGADDETAVSDLPGDESDPSAAAGSDQEPSTTDQGVPTSTRPAAAPRGIPTPRSTAPALSRTATPPTATSSTTSREVEPPAPKPTKDAGGLIVDAPF